MVNNFPMWQPTENSRGRDPRGYGVIPNAEQVFGNLICNKHNITACFFLLISYIPKNSAVSKT
jgi:hypothetical protein